MQNLGALLSRNFIEKFPIIPISNVFKNCEDRQFIMTTISTTATALQILPEVIISFDAAGMMQHAKYGDPSDILGRAATEKVIENLRAEQLVGEGHVVANLEQIFTHPWVTRIPNVSSDFKQPINRHRNYFDNLRIIRDKLKVEREYDESDPALRVAFSFLLGFLPGMLGAQPSLFLNPPQPTDPMMPFLPAIGAGLISAMLFGKTLARPGTNLGSFFIPMAALTGLVYFAQSVIADPNAISSISIAVGALGLGVLTAYKVLQNGRMKHITQRAEELDRVIARSLQLFQENDAQAVVSNYLRENPREFIENGYMTAYFARVNRDLRSGLEALAGYLKTLRAEQTNTNNENTNKKIAKIEILIRTISSLIQRARLLENESSEKMNADMESLANDTLNFHEAFSQAMSDMSSV